MLRGWQRRWGRWWYRQLCRWRRGPGRQAVRPLLLAAVLAAGFWLGSGGRGPFSLPGAANRDPVPGPPPAAAAPRLAPAPRPGAGAPGETGGDAGRNAGTRASGTAAGASQAAAPGAADGPSHHLVEPGDTLYGIARSYQVEVADLQAANGLPGDRILPGQLLLIPRGSPEAHLVRTGDTAWEIAEMYGVSLAQLADANPDAGDLGHLQVGQELKLPAGARWHPAAAAVPAIARGASFAWPLVGPITSRFGMRWGRTHSGIDIAADHGTAIRAARDGEVTTAGWLPGYGLTVILRHADGSQTLYAHTSQVLVQVNEAVGQGQLIARVGSTGRSTGPHLHFEIIAGRPMDPLRYLPNLSAAGR